LGSLSRHDALPIFVVGSQHGGPPRPVPLAVLVGGGALLAVLMVLFRRTHPLVPFALSVVLTAALPPMTLSEMLPSYAVGRYVGRWPARAGAIVVASVAIVQPWSPDTLTSWIARAGWASELGAVALVVVLPAALGIWQRTRAQLLDTLRKRAERAEAEQALLAREAILTERARIAREMHDAVGHHVSLMVLQLGAIEMATADRDRVAQLARQLQATGRQALDELRRMVGVLRAGDADHTAPLGPQPGLADLPRLADQSRAAGMAVELIVPPEESAVVDSVAARAAYRIVQEALTNAGKHARGAPVNVTVERGADALIVRVANGPPPGPVAPPAGGGFGLVGLGERARTLGGRLNAEPRADGGFTLEAVLPT
jgi:signal transduction histidine kinase